MTTSRNILRNRKTGESFVVNSATSLTPLSKQSVFTKKVDYSEVEQFIQHFAAMLPKTLPEKNKEKILIQLRQAFAEKDNEIAAFNNSKALIKLITECNKQASSTGFNPDALSVTGFLKFLGVSLISAEVNNLFPGLALLVSFALPAAAQSSNYTYHQGQPIGGENLCGEALYNCIQGYITEIGQDWNKDMPQVARLIDKEAIGIDGCVTQDDLQNMMDRAYRGPNESATNCTLTAAVETGGKLTVNATKVDPITCDIMQDSLIGFTQDCPTHPASSSNAPNYAPLYALIGVGVSIGALAILAFGLYKYREHRQKEQSLVINNDNTDTTLSFTHAKYGAL